MSLIHQMLPMLSKQVPALLKQAEPKVVQALSSRAEQIKAENPNLPIAQVGFFITEKDGKAMAFDACIDENGKMIKTENNQQYDLIELITNLVLQNAG